MLPGKKYAEPRTQGKTARGEALVPRLFYPRTGATQLGLFEERGGYTLDAGAAENQEFE